MYFRSVSRLMHRVSRLGKRGRRQTGRGARCSSSSEKRVLLLCEPLEDRLAPAVDAFIQFGGIGHDATIGESKPGVRQSIEITEFQFGKLRANLGPTDTF